MSFEIESNFCLFVCFLCSCICQSPRELSNTGKPVQVECSDKVSQG